MRYASIRRIRGIFVKGEGLKPYTWNGFLGSRRVAKFGDDALSAGAWLADQKEQGFTTSVTNNQMNLGIDSMGRLTPHVMNLMFTPVPKGFTDGAGI